MTDTQLRIGAVALVLLGALVPAVAAAESDLIERVSTGRSEDAEIAPGLRVDAEADGIAFDPVIKRGHGRVLVHFEPGAPLRLKRDALPDEDPTSAIRFLNALKGEMGLSTIAGMRVNRVRELAGGRLEYAFRQFESGYPVLNSRVSIAVDAAGNLVRMSGRYLPDDLLRGLSDSLPSFWSVSAAFPGGNRDRIEGVGIFHGSVFGMTNWEERAPTIAFVTVRKDARGVMSKAYVDWKTAETLHSIPLQVGVVPDVDIYSDADCSWLTEPFFFPDQTVRKESTLTCGAGNYLSGCSYWPGDTSRVNTAVHALGNHLNTQFGRFSWDGGQMSICDPNNPDIDPDQCCHSDSPSTMVTAANWLADDDSEQACCGIHGQICPAVIDGTLYENAFFYPYNCTTVFAHGTSCSDTIGHEFTHGVDFSEKQLNLCKASDANGLYCRHEEAMMEGIPDVLGEAFQQMQYPNEGTLWTLNDGQAYCTQHRFLDNPGDADHATTIDWYNTSRAARSHYNSTAVSKGLHLLGRPVTSGSAIHYGVYVTGIGISDASKVFYHALTEDLPDTTDRTFSDLRQALLISAGSQFGYASTQYYATQNMVNALGYWTPSSSWVQNLPSRPGLGLYGMPGATFNRFRTVVYQDGIYLKYRHRYLNGFMYQWSTPATIVTSSGSFDVFTETRTYQGIPLSYVLHVYYLTSTNQVRHLRIDGNGTVTDAAVLSNGLPVTVVSGSTIRVTAGTTYKLFFVPSGSNVKYGDLDISYNTLGNIMSSGIPASAAYDVDYQGTYFQAFWITGTQLHQMVSVGTAGAQWYEPGAQLWINTTNFAVQGYNGRLHLLTKNSINGWVYQTCLNNCKEVSDWLDAKPIDSKPDTDSSWAVLARYFAEDFGISLAMQKASGNMFYRTKYSQ